MLVTECADGSYCCGNDGNAKACCKEGRGVRIVDGQVANPSTSRRIGPATSAAASSMPSSQAFAPSPTPDEGSNKAAVIGGAVGGAVGAVVLASAVGFFWYRRKKRTKGAVQGHVVNEEGKHAPGTGCCAAPSELPENERLPVELGGESVPPYRR